VQELGESARISTHSLKRAGLEEADALNVIYILCAAGPFCAFFPNCMQGFSQGLVNGRRLLKPKTGISSETMFVRKHYGPCRRLGEIIDVYLIRTEKMLDTKLSADQDESPVPII
jgi:hypothetical protein